MKTALEAVAEVDFTTYEESVGAVLDQLGAREMLGGQTAVLLKPNLINTSPPPVTTPVECCEAVIRYVRSCSDAEIVVAEGCGDPHVETDVVFDVLGYTALADRCGVALLDLNHAPLRRLERADCTVFPEMYLPEIAFSHYLVSIPVLKAHSLATITGTLKNMMGLVPPEHYAGRFGTWKKAAFHGRMQESIIELNRYRCADLTVMDGRIGLADYHLGGPPCDPPVGRILAGFDPREVDRVAAERLGLEWRDIPHVAAED